VASADAGPAQDEQLPRGAKEGKQGGASGPSWPLGLRERKQGGGAASWASRSKAKEGEGIKEKSFSIL
jgi:hypothetical protein